MHTNIKNPLVALLVLVLLSPYVWALSAVQDDLVLSEGTAITVVTAQEMALHL